MRRCFRHPTFSHFRKTPTCDRRTGGYKATACTALAQRRAVKKLRTNLRANKWQALIHRELSCMLCFGCDLYADAGCFSRTALAQSNSNHIHRTCLQRLWRSHSPHYRLCYSAPQCSHCKRCTSYVRLSVRLSVCHTPVLCQNDCTLARCSLHCRIAKMCLVF